ncbi:MAG TPA: glycosyl transferase family 2, partial [Alistipes obesi]|nr:glycosyl transferase family 2 [Alistipes communis]
CNMAFWRDDAICVNGYNELIQGWGSEDYEFGSRLWHIGVQHFSLKLSGIVYHIYHNVRARDQAVANQVLANLTRSRRLLRCKQGISQYLYPDPETTTLVREVQE